MRKRIILTHRKVFVISRLTKMTVLINAREITNTGVIKSKKQFKVVAR